MTLAHCQPDTLDNIALLAYFILQWLDIITVAYIE